MLRVGVMGAGWVARDRHLPALLRHPDVEVVAVQDTSRSQVELDVPVRRVRELDELLALNLDAAVVCTPPWTHEDLTVRALEAGLHVLCEKPMADGMAAAQRMIEAAEAAEKTLTIVHNFLWSNAMHRARQELSSEEATRRHILATQFSSDRRRLPSWYPELRGGLLADEIPHLLYVTDSLLGGDLEVTDVRVEWGGRESEPEVCDVWIRGRRGSARLVLMFGAPVSEWHVSVCEPSTIVDLDLFRDVAISTGSDGRHTAPEVLRSSVGIAAQHFVGFARAGARVALRRQSWGHQGLIEAFVDSAANGAPNPVPLDRALAVVKASDVTVAAVERARPS